MKKNIYKCNSTLFKGYLYYEDRTPVKNAVVLLEMVSSKWEKLYMKSCNIPYFAYCTTNEYGEFSFRINDQNHYYKIKIFENYIIKNKNY